ncbi:MAG: winged helix-turn-helix domain-containing protein, partial [Pseudomonadota bacterium]
MKDGPDIARVAALIGDPARSNMLSALMGGKALTATELAAEAGVTAATASGHLGKLCEGRLLEATKQGRHRYYRLSGSEVADTLEALMGLAQHTGATRVRTGPRDPELRRARICYDHLAGEMGVALMDSLRGSGAVVLDDDTAELT